MLLDVRLPIGALFAVLGLLIGGYGVWAGASTPAGFIDAVWGLVMIAFGAPMAYFGWRATVRTTPPASHL
jgi:steroid 5-alpha reductase family enzyme